MKSFPIIHFTGHAGFILKTESTKLMIDPWLEGHVFNDGWALLSPYELEGAELESIHTIWFSHEHPDHFNIPTLKRFNKEQKERIKILYQRTEDKKVKTYCERQGFKQFRELENREDICLNKDLTIQMGRHTWGDSWLFVKTEGGTLLNINDCDFSDEKSIRELAAHLGHVDVLMAQFSYAHGINSKDARRAEAKKILGKLTMLIDILKPRFTVPFASFVYFCHEENFYLNDEINLVDEVYQYLLDNTETTPVILYPGDEWAITDLHNSNRAIDKYCHDYRQVNNRERLVYSERVGLELLFDKSQHFAKRLRERPSYKLVNVLLYPPRFFITDYNEAYYLSLHSGLVLIGGEAGGEAPVFDIKISSSALAFMFDFVWGGDTLNINGRYQRSENGDYARVHELSNLVLMEDSWGREFLSYDEWNTRMSDTKHLLQNMPSLDDISQDYPYKLEF